jgi:NAD(P)H dehydrogenase (quinone)
MSTAPPGIGWSPGGDLHDPCRGRPRAGHTEHKLTEQLILDSRLPYTFLRNGFYSEIYTENLAPVLEHGRVVANAGAGRIASASRADYAAAAAAVLTGEGHLDRAYELSGDTAWSFAEYAAEVSRQSGQTVTYDDVASATRLKVLIDAGAVILHHAARLGVTTP